MDNNVILRQWTPGRGDVDILVGTAFTGEEGAHTFRIGRADGGVISGDVTATFLAGNDVLIPLTGTVEDGCAVVTLSAACYQAAGRFVLSIYAAENGRTVCVYCGVGQVMNTASDSVYDPDDIVPSLQELLAQIGLMQAGTARANEAAGALENMSVSAQAASGQTPGAQVSEVDGHYHIAFSLVPATVSSQVTTYQVSASGTAVPTGTWVSTLPSCPQGQFLWTRTVIQWNGGQTTTVYSVSRQGIDGSGAVSTVNGISPDANGNVTLPADAAPAQGSTNPVQSGGVYAALSNLSGGLNTLSGDLTALSGDVETLEGDVARHTTEIGSMDTRLADLEAEPLIDLTADVTMVKSGGNNASLVGYEMYRRGNVVTFSITMRSTGTISAGSAMAYIDVTGAPVPVINPRAVMYHGSSVLFGNFDKNTNRITVAVLSASLASGNSFMLTFVYLAAPEEEPEGEGT